MHNFSRDGKNSAQPSHSALLRCLAGAASCRRCFPPANVV